MSTVVRVPTEPHWLDAREDRAWRAFMHARHQLTVRLQRHLLEDSGLTDADYEILAVLSEHPAGRMPAQELCALLQWEKSRLSHQARRMEEQGVIAREPNPADARSVIICLLPAGRRAIEAAAPQHVHNVRQHFISLFTPVELDILATLNERVLSHLAEEPFPEQSTPDDPALPRSRADRPHRTTQQERPSSQRSRNQGPREMPTDGKPRR